MVSPDSLDIRTHLVRHERHYFRRRLDPVAPIRFAGANRRRKRTWRGCGDAVFTFGERAGQPAVTAGRVPNRCLFESGDGQLRPIERRFDRHTASVIGWNKARHSGWFATFFPYCGDPVGATLLFRSTVAAGPGWRFGLWRDNRGAGPDAWHRERVTLLRPVRAALRKPRKAR